MGRIVAAHGVIVAVIETGVAIGQSCGDLFQWVAIGVFVNAAGERVIVVL